MPRAIWVAAVGRFDLYGYKDGGRLHSRARWGPGECWISYDSLQADRDPENISPEEREAILLAFDIFNPA